jgi:fatty-acyl-CoA synthase
MHNCSDYVAVWLGVAKAGGLTALLNTNLTGAPLAHAIATALKV